MPKYLLGILVMLIGLVSIILDDPIYSAGIMLLGFLMFPVSWKLVEKISRNPVSAVLKASVLLGLIAVLAFGLLFQGGQPNDKSEPRSETDIAALSIHPIRTQKVSGLDYYYIEEGEGEVIFLLHGFPDMANTWDETVTELSKEYRVIAPFLRGYYPTDIPSDGDYSVKTIAEDVVNLANRLGIEKFRVVGQDWGASISYSVASLVPERVVKIVGIAIPHSTCITPSLRLLYDARHFLVFGQKGSSVRHTRKNNFAYVDTLYQRWSPDYLNFKESSDAIKETFKYPGRLEAALGYYWSFSEDQADKERVAFYANMPNIPVLYLAGASDKFLTESILECTRAKMPSGSKVVVFENAGHFLHREVLDQFVTASKSFLAEE